MKVKTTKNTELKPFQLRAQFGLMPVAIKRVYLPCYRKATRNHPQWDTAVSVSLSALAEDLGLCASFRPSFYQINPL
jgi:hypothetical protein